MLSLHSQSTLLRSRDVRRGCIYDIHVIIDCSVVSDRERCYCGTDASCSLAVAPSASLFNVGTLYWMHLDWRECSKGSCMLRPTRSSWTDIFVALRKPDPGLQSNVIGECSENEVVEPHLLPCITNCISSCLLGATHLFVSDTLS